MNLVILASGLATRLIRVHQGLYPKILMNLGNETILDKIIGSCNYETITIILNNEIAKEQIIEYLKVKGKYDENVYKFLIKHVSLSTAHTLTYFKSLLPKENVVFNWSDVYVNDLEQYIKKDEFLVVCDNERRHRLWFRNFKIGDDTLCESSMKRGNVCGIYYCPNIEFLNKFELEDIEETDFDLLLNVNYLTRVTLDIVDTGDLEKYYNELKNLEIDTNGRYFNSITISDNEVIKKSLTDKGHELIQKEMKYYEKNIPIFPKYHLLDKDNNIIKMDRVQGMTIHDFISKKVANEFGYDNKKLYNLFVEEITNKLHNTTTTYPLSKNDLIKEYVDVTLDRLNSIKHILPKIKTVNGVFIPIENLEKDLNKFVDIYSKYNKDSKLIHGDTNTSNTMITLNDGIKLIDPRGYFGYTNFYGDPKYDYAKFLYGLSGYDDFNKFRDYPNEYNIFAYNSKNVECYEFGDIGSIVDDVELQMLVAIIWLKLPAYIINDFNKAIISYSNGLRLFYKNFKKYKLKYDK